MRAVIITGLVACLAGVAYAEGTDKDKAPQKETHPSAASKGMSPSHDTTATKNATKKPMNANETALLNDLHAANQTEIAAGKLAEKNSQSKAVKEYARMLTKDHTAADRKLKGLTKRNSVELTTSAKPSTGVS